MKDLDFYRNLYHRVLITFYQLTWIPFQKWKGILVNEGRKRRKGKEGKGRGADWEKKDGVENPPELLNALVISVIERSSDLHDIVEEYVIRNGFEGNKADLDFYGIDKNKYWKERNIKDMKIEDRIKVVKIGDNPNFSAEEFQAEIFKKFQAENPPPPQALTYKAPWITKQYKPTNAKDKALKHQYTKY